MAKFEVIYVVTSVKTYSIEVTAIDSEAAENKIRERVDKLLDEGKKLPGDVQDDDVSVEIEESSEL